MSKEGPEGASAALDELFRSVRAVEDVELARALKGKIYLAEGEVNRVFLEDGYSSASIPKRLAAIGLGLHVLRLKGLIKDDDVAKPADWFAEQAQERPKTVLENLSKLKRQKLFERTELGYRIPSWALRKAIEYVTSNNNS